MPENQKLFLYGDSDYLFGLSKFTGKKVADIVGFPSDPFGGTPVFIVYQVVFEDGTTTYVEGEHDTPYIPPDDKLKNMDEDTLQRFVE